MKLSLLINVHPSLIESPEVQALRAKGHTIELMGAAEQAADLVMGPNCWRIVPSLLKYLALAVKEARKVRRQKA